MGKCARKHRHHGYKDIVSVALPRLYQEATVMSLIVAVNSVRMLLGASHLLVHKAA